MIELIDLTKFYGETRGIEGVNLKVEQGTVFGFLGPNGAGKSTTIRVMLDLLRPTRGTALINGYDCNKEAQKVKEVVEYLPGDFAGYRHLTCAQYIRFMAGFYRGNGTTKKGQELARYFELDTSRRVGQCSKGMRQKLGIIQTFMVDCPIYILDEPTDGLDPLMQQKFYALIEERKAQGKTVFFSSHVLSEVERVCDTVGIIRGGNLIEVDAIDNLKHKKFKEVRLTYSENPPENLFQTEGIEVISQDGPAIRLRISSRFGENIHRLTSVPVLDIRVNDPSLEEIFLSYYEGGEE